MNTVKLDANEWNIVMATLANGPWNQVNAVLLKIGGQLQAQQNQQQTGFVDGSKVSGNSQTTEAPGGGDAGSRH